MVYFDWLASLKFSFPPEMLKPIRQAVIGFIGQLKDKIVNGFGSVINRVRGKSPQNNAEANNNQANPESPNVVKDNLA